MTTVWLVLLSVLSQSMSVSTETRLGKCCPPGKVYSDRSTVDCVPTLPGSEELHSLGTRPKPTGFLECKNVENVTTTALDKLDPATHLVPTACIDILYDNSTQKSIPTVVHCQSSEDSEDQDKETVKLPSLLDVRRCCPKDNLYDLRWKSCVPVAKVNPDVNDSSVDQLLDFLPQQLDCVDYLKVKTGVQNCTHVIFDYVLDKDALFVKHGQLHAILSGERGDDEKIVPLTSETACLAVTTGETRRIVARVCEGLDFCQNKRCIRKCCRYDEGIYRKCRPHVSPDRPIEFHEGIANITNWNAESGYDYGLMHGKPCSGLFLPELHEWKLTWKGRIATSYKVYSQNEYCMDIIYNNSRYYKALYTFLCFADSNADDTTATRYNISTVLEMISSVFLLITFLVYVCLPDLQNLHGKTLMCHVISLWLTFTCKSIVTWITPATQNSDNSEMVLCISMGYIMLFAFLASFSWMNVMCFDIWWTFGGLRGGSTRGRSQNKKFLLYCLYAWGAPLLITIVSIIIDQMMLLPEEYAPRVGYLSCWFAPLRNCYGEVIFFSGPTTVQLLTNVVFFVLTSVHCSRVKAEIQKLIVDPSHTRSKGLQANKSRFLLNLKLFVVMGISLIMGVVSFYVMKFTDFEWANELVFATDVVNYLQGPFIFILFVMKIQVYRALRRRLGLGDKKKSGSPGTTTLQGPFRAKKSASNSMLTSTFTTSVTRRRSDNQARKENCFIGLSGVHRAIVD